MVRTDARWAGSVKRWSTWPVLQPQTNAEHTWQVLRILTTIWPDAPALAMVYCLHHDSGEQGAGDIPWPYKGRVPQLKSIMDQLESESLRDQGISMPIIDQEWRWRIKTADLIEMLEKGMEEILLGNRYAVPVVRGIEAQLSERLVGQMDRPVVESYLADRWRRYREAEAMS